MYTSTHFYHPVHITKEDSYRLKGIALIMMVSMHLMRTDWIKYPDMLWDIKVFGHNLSYLITQALHASTAIFAFITGFAWGVEREIQSENQYKIKKILSVYISYWVVLFTINIPFIWINGTIDIHNLKEFILCIFALSSKLSTYCWYIAFFAAAVLTFSTAKKILEKLKCNVFIKILLTVSFFYGIRVMIKLSTHFGFDNATINQFLSTYGSTMPILIIGYLVSHEHIFAIIDKKLNKIKKSGITLIAISFLLLLSIIKGYLNCIINFRSDLEAVWIIFEIYFLLILIRKICQIIYIDKLLKWFGKHSLYIWLIHSIFLLSNIQKLTFMPHLPIFIITIILVISSLISIPIKYLDGKLQKAVKIK